MIARWWTENGGRQLSSSETEALQIRSGSRKNPHLLPPTSQSFADFDWPG
ncbi:MAG TPA: hypothetical protein PLM24_00665 [Methanothrix sp.]|nr:hypothetical protein [Methanothrix sp.]HPJ84147.1 hypothetical protein [Methanothrix sp.]HPR65629.1 hypothetical protein [Methanothrix sp.]